MKKREKTVIEFRTKKIHQSGSVLECSLTFSYSQIKKQKLEIEELFFYNLRKT